MASFSGAPVASGSGNSVAVDLIGGLAYQAFKLDLGAIGVSSPATGFVPVSQIGTWSQNLSQINSQSVAASAGPTTLGTQRVVIANDQWPIPVLLSSPWVGTLTGTGAMLSYQSSTPWVVTDTGTGYTLAVQSGTWNVSLSGTQVVSGLVGITNFPATQAVTQSGTWTVQPGNTANTTPWITNTPGGSSQVQVIGTIPTLASQSGTWIVSGNVNVLNVPAVSQSGTWTVQQGGSPWTTVSPGGSSQVQVIGTVPVSLSGTQLVSGNVGATQSGAWVVTDTSTGYNQSIQSGVWTVQPGNTPNTSPWIVNTPGASSSVQVLGTVPVSLSGTQLVSGNINVLNTLLVHPVTQSGTWTVQPGNTPNTVPWIVTTLGASSTVQIIGVTTVQPGNTPNTVPWVVTTPGASSTVQIVGTVPTHPVTQSGTWTVQPGNTPNTAPWVVTTPGASSTVQINSQVGAPNFATGQVTITSSGTLILPARTTRRGLSITNHGIYDVFIGGAGVSATTGYKLKGIDGASVAMDITSAVSGIVLSSTQVVSWIEIYE